MDDNVTPLKSAIKFVKRHLRVVFVFSFLINLLMLTAPLYMLQVYDRVLTARSEYTLLFLSLLALAALAALAVFDILRSRLLVRISCCFDQQLSPLVFAQALKLGLGAQLLRDLDNVRNFFTGPTLLAFFDAPWAPLYLLAVYVLHPWLGHVALVGALILFALGLLSELLTKRWLMESASCESVAQQFVESSSRNSDAIIAMGMLGSLRNRWVENHHNALGFQAGASDRASVIAATAKFIRFGLQIAILGVGAFLAISDQLSPGAMIAASIIMGRGLAPVEASISGWRNGVLARKAYHRLSSVLMDEETEKMPLPPPRGKVTFDNVYAAPPSDNTPNISGVSFVLGAGQTLGITGPSAAGKSSIAKLMVGIWEPLSGSVRLDDADSGQWDAERLGPYIGYLPQDIELFNGTVSENIARFGEVDPDAVVVAARLAGADEMIRELPEGYNTVIGAAGCRLSGGQRQRIGLARAFYRTPPLIVLDEPTSNLDAMGEAAVRSAIDRLRASGCTVAVIAHKPTLIGGVDLLLVIQKGQMTHFGPTAEVLPQITRRVERVENPAVNRGVPA